MISTKEMDIGKAGYEGGKSEKEGDQNGTEMLGLNEEGGAPECNESVYESPAEFSDGSDGGMSGGEGAQAKRRGRRTNAERLRRATAGGRNASPLLRVWQKKREEERASETEDNESESGKRGRQDDEEGEQNGKRRKEDSERADKERLKRIEEMLRSFREDTVGALKKANEEGEGIRGEIRVMNEKWKKWENKWEEEKKRMQEGIMDIGETVIEMRKEQKTDIAQVNVRLRRLEEKGSRMDELEELVKGLRMGGEESNGNAVSAGKAKVMQVQGVLVKGVKKFGGVGKKGSGSVVVELENEEQKGWTMGSRASLKGRQEVVDHDRTRKERKMLWNLEKVEMVERNTDEQ
ncbi:DEAD-box ATP-dependent RNA helicase 42-like [Fopius arisanus]|uniref:DEAD-box ATP-dependent RNA helicase 42-like n=1 Tax=Fopius arisanus TaxID=64838 RepID=A0A9R1TXA6_9HYME|nr:PREDICTED: DEAD-box ATP-dependent RNA helicase 42-like [Fopius arisanus]